MTTEYHFTVRAYELDSFGHVNNAVYLNYIEQARWEILRTSNMLEDLKNKNLFFVVVETTIRYIRETREFDELVVQSEVSEDKPYLLVHHTINNVNTKRKIAKAEVRLLLVDKNRIACDFPEGFLNKIMEI